MFYLDPRKISWSPIQNSLSIFEPLPASPLNPSSIYTLKVLKDRKNLVERVKSMHHGYELTGLYQEALRMFGVQPGKSFERFLQALALHENPITHTFFKTLWLPHTCIPPRPVELPCEIFSDLEEDCDPEKLEAKRVQDSGIVF